MMIENMEKRNRDGVDISVVIPVYGCPEALPELYSRLVAVLEGMQIEFEIVMVDDSCPMGSWATVQDICMKDKRVKGIHFTKNFGQGCAVTAGVAASRGNWIITIDCDLQDVPENIPDLYNKVLEGYDVVFVRRTKRKDPFITQQWAKLFHKAFCYMTEVNYDFDLATYLIASRRAADKFLESKDRGRDFGMYLMWLGYKHTFMEFEHGERHSGESSYSFIKKVKTAVGDMTSFSNRVLYIPIYLGLLSAAVSLIYIVYVFYRFFALGTDPEGWSTLAAAVFLFGGMILSTLGIMGIYLGNIFDMNKDRPLYVVQDSINLE